MNYENNDYSTPNYEMPENNNAYYVPPETTPPRRKKTWVKWIIIGAIVNVLLVAVPIIAISVFTAKTLTSNYDISDKDIIIDAADEIDMDLEKIDTEYAQDIFGDAVKKCYYGEMYDDYMDASLMWVEFSDEELAYKYYSSYVEDLEDTLEDYKDSGKIENYTWTNGLYKCEFSYKDEFLSDDYDFVVKDKTLVCVDNEFFLVFSIYGESDEVIDTYADFVEYLK